MKKPDSVGARAVELLKKTASKNGHQYGRGSGEPTGLRSDALAKALDVDPKDLPSLLKTAVRDGHIVACDIIYDRGRRGLEYRIGSGIPAVEWEPLKPTKPTIVNRVSLPPAKQSPDAQPAVARNTGSVPSEPPLGISPTEGHAADEVPPAAHPNAAGGVSEISNPVNKRLKAKRGGDPLNMARYIFAKIGYTDGAGCFGFKWQGEHQGWFESPAEAWKELAALMGLLHV